ncbi:probable LRR receptor-like serine/threonine-protein kinase At1g07650 isoform X2 [Solanum pennellii]|uniref:non-specific serine/threonine protein kinase n=1 Tax=Solanum pennellii TaxID=28526 RepID=A0ABM1HAN5_SOLPN|nr:probable LRR receptor-like serine/threonine-protein kinase At1g07650 isoform X2 [Solanum pennellii]
MSIMKILFLQSFSFSLFLVFFTVLAVTSKSKLPQEEVKALKVIAKKFGKRDWDFNKDPCSGEGNWSTAITVKGFESSVACDCSFNNNSTCHITSIALKAQNISATIPPEFAQLRHLKYLDLSRNYLNGSIPFQWASLRLLELSFMGNHLSGRFPKVLTRITTLRNLSIEGNKFSGTIPPEIGNLVHMEKLVLSSNKLTGALPATLAKLTNLTDLRINDNNFTGKIPKFISSWTKIEKLRISDLKSGKSGFPPLDNLESIKILVLRNCLIHGEMPEYIGEMKKLKTLDLSFNSLSGEIPSSFVHLSKVDFIYLTANKLTGLVPGWILNRNKNIDVSNNNFTWETSPFECPRGNQNLVESYSALGQESNKTHPCLKQNFPCSEPIDRQQYSMYINCGGKEVTIKDGTKYTNYEADLEPRGASMYYSRHNWAFSSTGNFMDNDVESDVYINTNISALQNVKAPELELYTTARISPLSLTYYGQCLMNGNYTVKLHFAEIIFTNDTSFNSLGERIFDVYLQENLVLKDFNIANEAGGPGKAIVKTFTVNVTSHTLKIHFYWAGKGTTGIPFRGVYGPLISAISVVNNFPPPLPARLPANLPAAEKSKIHVGILAGIIAGSLFLVLLIIGILYKGGCLGENVSTDKELKGLDLQAGLFTLRQIKAATKNFDPANKIGEGGFGSVYKGLLSDGTVIAVKQLSAKSKQGTREFLNEIGMISAVQHPNLVKLYGCCIQGNQLLLVYEYMENNCVSRVLFGKGLIGKMKLDWSTRKKICLGIARGLAYLHEESSLKIVHRDIKTSNILLDKDFNPKISDFGLAKLHEDDTTHISTRIAGTVGYMAPEYAMRGYLTSKADIYSYGVVALEIISGKSNTNYRPTEDCVYLLDWAYVLQERGSILELVDPDLGSDYSSQEAIVLLNVALLCTNASPTLRPIMSQVVSMLQGQTLVQDVLSDPGISTSGSGFRSTRSHFWQTQSLTNGTLTDSTLSTGIAEEIGILQRVEPNVSNS